MVGLHKLNLMDNQYKSLFNLEFRVSVFEEGFPTPFLGYFLMKMGSVEFSYFKNNCFFTMILFWVIKELQARSIPNLQPT